MIEGIYISKSKRQLKMDAQFVIPVVGRPYLFNRQVFSPGLLTASSQE